MNPAMNQGTLPNLSGHKDPVEVGAGPGEDDLASWAAHNDEAAKHCTSPTADALVGRGDESWLALAPRLKRADALPQ